jgi:lysophospholipase L1-like esterase
MAALALVAVVSLGGLARGALADGDFAIHDGDRIVFYGDSITDQRLYTTYVESYIVTRFPTLNVSFVHSGWGGDRVSGGGGGPIDLRLNRDVFAYKPTVVTVMLGMNDASYRPFNQAIFDAYSRGYTHLVDSMKRNLPGVRITLIQPSPYDDVTRDPWFEGGYNSVLVRYAEFVKELAAKEGASVADLNTPVVAALKKAVEVDKKQAAKLIEDRVHPGPAGQLLMAEALLKAWNAPALVTLVEIDAAAGKVIAAQNTKVDGLIANGVPTWTQEDRCLPMPINLKDSVISLAVKASDVVPALDQESLKVSGLSADRYVLKIDAKEIGELTKDRLAAGVNLAELETPMLHQAMAVHHLTLLHNNIHFERWRALQVPLEGAKYPALAKALAALDALEAEMVAEQRAKAKPVPHRFELVPHS